MVSKLGFIGEGETEATILKSEKFIEFLERFGFEFVGARDAGGRGNFEKNNGIVDSHIKSLLKNGAEKIFIITDLENYSCISLAKQSIAKFSNDQIVIIIPKALEALFLAESDALNKILKTKRSYLFPENTVKLPFDEINDLFSQDGIKEVKSKNKMTKRFLSNGFTIENASQHPYCKSAKYLLKKMKELIEE